MRHKFFCLFHTDDALCRAFFLAKTTTCALVIIYDGKVVDHLDCVVRADACTHTASKAGIFADCLCVFDTFHAV